MPLLLSPKQGQSTTSYTYHWPHTLLLTDDYYWLPLSPSEHSYAAATDLSNQSRITWISRRYTGSTTFAGQLVWEERIQAIATPTVLYVGSVEWSRGWQVYLSGIPVCMLKVTLTISLSFWDIVAVFIMRNQMSTFLRILLVLQCFGGIACDG